MPDKTLMKKSGAAAKIGSSMVKGETPYDQAKVQEIYAAFADDAKQMPTLFPDCSKTGDDTTASPAIWDKSDDFKAAIAKFSTDVKAAQDNTKDLDSLKANFQTIGQDCGGCHQTLSRRERAERRSLRTQTSGHPRGCAALCLFATPSGRGRANGKGCAAAPAPLRPPSQRSSRISGAPPQRVENPRQHGKGDASPRATGY